MYRNDKDFKLIFVAISHYFMSEYSIMYHLNNSLFYH